MSSNERRYRPTNYADSVLPFDATTRSENRQLRGFPPCSDRYNPYYRRRTADNFPVPEPVHIAPTISRSSLTDPSMDSKNNLLPFNYIYQPVLTPVDIGKQISQQNRPRFPLIKKFTPTRIPSPVWNATIKDRHVSIPVLPSQKLLKENEKQKPQRSQDAISTSNRPPLHLPKSRTIGILSNFTTSFSRASLSLDDCRQASITATHPVNATTCDPKNIIIPASTSSMHQIHASKMNSYWCGRFQALCDRFHDENFLANSDAAQQYLTDDSDSYSPSSTPTLSSKEIPGSKLRPSKAGDDNTYPQSRISRSKDEEQDKRSSRAFHHLQSLCATNEAKKSLWEFQLHFARIERKPNLLPKGGKMEDGRGGWLGRVGKAMAWGNSTGLGPPTSVGMGKRKNSMVDFLDS